MCDVRIHRYSLVSLAQRPLISWHWKENTKLATTQGEKDCFLFEKAPKTLPCRSTLEKVKAEKVARTPLGA